MTVTSHLKLKITSHTKITHDIYDPDASLKLANHSDSITRGYKYKLSNQRFHYDLRKCYFSARIVNIWDSLPNHVVGVNTVNVFKTRLDGFWANQDVKYDFTAYLTGTGDRSMYVLTDFPSACTVHSNLATAILLANAHG